jgi:uncharacterized protein YndB with AHSA1/START domain
MARGAQASVTMQVYEIYVRASAQAIWDAITSPEWSVKYGYKGIVEYDLRPGGVFRSHTTPELRAAGLPDVAVDGEVELADPPRKLVHTYRFLFSDQMKAEGFTRVTWEIEPTSAAFCRLTVIHELENAPIMANMVSSPFSEQGAGGWSWILSDMKSLLETGTPM